MNDKLIELDVFTIDQCEAIANQVIRMHPYLIDRGGFFTLGAATYQDNPLAYPAIANAFNLLLEAQFGDMYNTVNRVLEAHFAKPIGRVTTGVALPSFHLFDADSNGMLGHPHIDEPYTRVDFTGLDWSEPFSFTIPVMLPPQGGGVDFWWNFTDADIETFVESNELPEAEYMPYERGKMYIHDGKTPHRIASVGIIEEGQFRITLQGHGIHTADGVIVYF